MGIFGFRPQRAFKYDGNTVINVTENLLNQNEGIGSILEDKTVHFGLMPTNVISIVTATKYSQN
jgi:hypothetical protein